VRIVDIKGKGQTPVRTLLAPTETVDNHAVRPSAGS
jgi:hypothetical protein